MSDCAYLPVLQPHCLHKWISLGLLLAVQMCGCSHACLAVLMAYEEGAGCFAMFLGPFHLSTLPHCMQSFTPSQAGNCRECLHIWSLVSILYASSAFLVRCEHLQAQPSDFAGFKHYVALVCFASNHLAPIEAGQFRMSFL